MPWALGDALAGMTMTVCCLLSDQARAFEDAPGAEVRRYDGDWRRKWSGKSVNTRTYTTQQALQLLAERPVNHDASRIEHGDHIRNRRTQAVYRGIRHRLGGRIAFARELEHLRRTNCFSATVRHAQHCRMALLAGGGQSDHIAHDGLR